MSGKGSGSTSPATLVFAFTIFCGAAILFLMEPHVGKSLLPWYGGTPAVWNTCLFFFQFVLLAGYLYAYVLQNYLSVRRQVLLHGLILLATLAVLPLKLKIAGLAGSVQNPVGNVLIDLTVSFGAVFFLISTTAPLMQSWYAAAKLPGSPYLFYAASNLGSLVGLLLYPTLFETRCSLSQQSLSLKWSVGALAVLIVLCGVLVWSRSDALSPRVSQKTLPLSWRTKLQWLGWSFCPSSLMLGVTTYLTSEIAPIPALWMLPLGLYLLTFVIAFSGPPAWLRPCCSVGFMALALAVAGAGLRQYNGGGVTVALHCGLLFCGALALHLQLAASRPDVQHLTEYYLWISLGGVLGSAWNSLLAPLVFNWFAEYPLMIAATLFLIAWPEAISPRVRWSAHALRIGIATGVLGCLSWNIYFSPASQLVLQRTRTFFGEFQVTRGKQGVMRQLVHGRTVHGMQIASRDPKTRRPPLTYYFFTGPIGQTILAFRAENTSKSVAIVGLGIGSLASYAEPGDTYIFYEIDPAIERAAQNDDYFTFLSDARARGAKTGVILGDARLRLREAADHAYGMIVLDAFTSDSIPVHLLTKDAIQEYLTKLKPQGLLAFHISNLYVDLEPVLANLAAELDLAVYIQHDNQLVEEEQKRGKSPSTWMVMARSAEDLSPLLGNNRWQPARQRPELGVWTDDYSNLISVLKFGQPTP